MVLGDLDTCEDLDALWRVLRQVPQPAHGARCVRLPAEQTFTRQRASRSPSQPEMFILWAADSLPKCSIIWQPPLPCSRAGAQAVSCSWTSCPGPHLAPGTRPCCAGTRPAQKHCSYGAFRTKAEEFLV